MLVLITKKTCTYLLDGGSLDNTCKTLEITTSPVQVANREAAVKTIRETMKDVLHSKGYNISMDAEAQEQENISIVLPRLTKNKPIFGEIAMPDNYLYYIFTVVEW